MHINRIFEDEHDHENLIDETRTHNHHHRTSPMFLPHARSETNLINMSTPLEKKSNHLSNSSDISKSCQESYDIGLVNKTGKCSPS